jgi:hypothetical protein
LPAGIYSPTGPSGGLQEATTKTYKKHRKSAFSRKQKFRYFDSEIAPSPSEDSMNAVLTSKIKVLNGFRCKNYFTGFGFFHSFAPRLILLLYSAY